MMEKAVTAMTAGTSAAEAGVPASEDRESLLRELDHRVRNNLSVLLGLVRLHLEHPPSTATAALSRVAGQIMALSTIYDLTKWRPEEGRGSAAELCASFIADMKRNLCPRCGIEFIADVQTAEIPVEVARTLGIVLGEMLLDSMERSTRAGRTPEMKVALAYEDGCRFSIKVTDRAPREDDRLIAATLARALGGELRTTGGADFTERLLLFSSADADGSCRDA
jgi:two-component sensor histidine kinase